MTSKEEYLEQANKRLSELRELTKVEEFSGKVDAANSLLLELLKLLSELKFLLKFPVRDENPTEIVSRKKTVTTAGTAEQLPVVEIPRGCKVVIKALSGNGGIIYVGNSKADAEDTTKSFPLAAGDTVDYMIRNLSQLWINASASGEGVIWTAEQAVMEVE